MMQRKGNDDDGLLADSTTAPRADNKKVSFVKRLVFSGVHKRFGERQILNNVYLSIAPGECQLLLGRNGAGKSTLLRIVAGIERPDRTGVVVIDGDVQSWYRAKQQLLRKCSYLHQQPCLFAGSVRHNLNYPLRGPRAARESRIREALEWSGLSELSERPVQQLSGGERQRVALVRAWMRAPQVMLFDEPTANLDTESRRRTLDLLHALKKKKTALLIATHEPRSLDGIPDRTLELKDGRLYDLHWMRRKLPDNVIPMRSFRVRSLNYG